MRKIGITGSIGMGKTTVARIMEEEGVPVFYADKAVHTLLGPGGAAVNAIKALFPEAIRHNEAGRAEVDRALLGKKVFFDKEAMHKLEDILHPLVHKEESRFYHKHKNNPSGFVAFDIPLLFETGRDAWMDRVMVASAPSWLQKKRVLSRAGMTEERFKAILTMQMLDAEKRKKADAVIHTGGGIAVSRKEIRQCLKKWRHKQGV